MNNTGPIVQKMSPGKYVWCTCGQSSKQPFCDGSHESTGMRPMFVEIIEEKVVAWCTCKTSNIKPFCDGSHNKR